jgi:hypothetical protein
MLDLDAIEARADAATEGPWFNNRNGVVIVESHPLAPTVSENSSWGDAEFIAAARADIPALVAELRAARADLGLVHLALQHDRDCEEEGEGECCLSHWRSIVIAVAPDLARNVTGQELADLAAFRAVVGEQE